jgi:hypothetical protein
MCAELRDERGADRGNRGEMRTSRGKPTELGVLAAKLCGHQLLTARGVDHKSSSASGGGETSTARVAPTRSTFPQQQSLKLSCGLRARRNFHTQVLNLVSFEHPFWRALTPANPCSTGNSEHVRQSQAGEHVPDGLSGEPVRTGLHRHDCSAVKRTRAIRRLGRGLINTKPQPY